MSRVRGTADKNTTFFQQDPIRKLEDACVFINLNLFCILRWK